MISKESSDFLEIDLSRSKNNELNSDFMITMLVRIFIKWNRNNPENALHFYCGDLLERQVAIQQIQKWFRKIRHIKKLRQEMLESMQSQEK